MMPTTYALTIYRGDTCRWQFKLWHDTGKTQPVDLAGAVAKAEIRPVPNSATVVPLTCVLTLPNIIDVTLLAGSTQPLVTTRGVWDLQLTFPDGDVRTVIAGQVTLKLDITDSPTTPVVQSDGR